MTSPVRADLRAFPEVDPIREMYANLERRLDRQFPVSGGAGAPAGAVRPRRGSVPTQLPRVGTGARCVRRHTATHPLWTRAVAAVALAVCAALLVPSIVSAHHTTVSCASPGVWSIENSEPISMTYTTNQGHSGSIGPNGTVNVTYSGTSLTVFGVWANSVTNTNTGTGDCTVSTTTEGPSSTTTSPTTSTAAPASTTQPETSSPTSTSVHLTTSTVNPSTPSSVPSSTLPLPSSTLPLIPPVTGERPTTTVNSGDCSLSSSTSTTPDTSPPTTPCTRPSLPATATSPWPLIIIGGLTLSFGVCLVWGAACSKRDQR